ncbi:MAG TPA: thioredoxin family protein [Parafilimonas sp.]|nr:thioredoxin family protein [Parafilimonas sp.]
MQTLTSILFSTILFLNASWQTDFERAKSQAKTENKFILLNFSGSDWCGPCIRLHKEIFDSEVFTKYADENLVLVNADFPRLKKNMLSKEQQKQNDALADKYNTDGAFPLTLLLDADGKVIKKWDGFPSETAAEFTNDVKAAADANH